MAKQTIGVGSVANDGTGDTIRVGFIKVNENFTELYDFKTAFPATLAAVATTGAYSDLSGKPTIITASGTPTSAQVAVWSSSSNLTGVTGYLVPAGGTTDQALVKSSGTAGATTWATIALGSDITDITDTLTSVLDGEGSGYIGFYNQDLIFNGADNVQSVLYDIDANFIKQSDAQAVTEATSFTISDFLLFEKASDGTYFKVQTQIALAGAPSLREFSGTTDTAVVTDTGGTVISTGSAAAIATLPTNAAAPIPINTEIEYVQKGSGVLTVAGDTGVTVNGASGGSADIDDRYGKFIAHKIATNEWNLNYVPPPATVSDVVAPTLVSVTPADNATGVVTSAILIATFSEAIAFGTGNIVIRENNGGGFTDKWTFNVATDVGVVATKVNIIGNQLYIYPDAALTNDYNYAVRIANTCIVDLAANAYAGITNDTTWNFQAVAASPSGVTKVADGGSTGIVVTPGALGTTQTVALTGLAAGDKVIVFGCCDAAAALPTGYTAIYDSNPSTDPCAYAGFKVMGGSPDTSILVPRHASRNVCFTYIVLRGAHATMDGAATSANSATNGTPIAPSYTQTNASVYKIIAGYLDDQDVTLTSPAGWTTVTAMISGGGTGNGSSLAVAIKTPAGSASDVNAGGTFTGGTETWRAIHFAQQAA